MARPTKRTPTTEEKIIEAIRQGMTYRLSALYAGIGESTLRDWMAKGDAGDEQFTGFVAAVRQAEAEGALANLRFINKSMDWRARAWVLEHRHPEEYGAKNTLKLTGDDDAPITVRTVTFIAPPEASDAEN